MIVAVDFDFTLAIGNTQDIAQRVPNHKLIQRLQQLRDATGCTINILTARGAADGKTLEQKHADYLQPITEWLHLHKVPYDNISFNKEYAHLYIDDLAVRPDETLEAETSHFTGNTILYTQHSVLKCAPTALQEAAWYAAAQDIVPVPHLLSCNSQYIALQRIRPKGMVDVQDAIQQLHIFASHTIANHPYATYRNYVRAAASQLDTLTREAMHIIHTLPEQEPTFFHGDYSVLNLLPCDGRLYCIDPAMRGVFGNYMTDAGKLAFSYIAYYRDFGAAVRIAAEFGQDVLRFAVAEGCRVARHKKEYTDIVNNIALVCTR